MVRWLRPAATLLLVTGCSLMPVHREHVVRLAFQPPGGSQYVVDAPDSAGVYRTDGLVVTVRYLSRQQLEAEYGQHRIGRVNLNPFTYGPRIDNDLGYVPDRFTVFEVDVNNIGLPKVRLDPRRAVLVTDRGERMPSWVVEKGQAAPSFEEYYGALRGPGGNDQDWYRQRVSIAERALYNGERPVFKGERNRGKLVFAALPPRVHAVRLELRDVVLAFDENGLPSRKEDLVFPFGVRVLIREAETP